MAYRQSDFLGVNWDIWRIVTYPNMNETYQSVSNWSMRQLTEAHIVLDSYDAQQQYENSKAVR